MTDTQKETVKRLLENVTPGPWSYEILVQDDPDEDEWPTDIEVTSQSGRCIHSHDLGYDPDVDLEIIANARFITAARELVPALIAERSTLKAKLAKAAACIVESMIAPEALMIAGKPVGMTYKTWEQMVRSVGHARAVLAEIKGESHDG